MVIDWTRFARTFLEADHRVAPRDRDLSDRDRWGVMLKLRFIKEVIDKWGWQIYIRNPEWESLAPSFSSAR